MDFVSVTKRYTKLNADTCEPGGRILKWFPVVVRAHDNRL